MQHYQDMINYANSIITIKPGNVLYCGIDVVNYAYCEDNIRESTSLQQLKKLIRSLAISGVIKRTAQYEISLIPPLEHDYTPLDQKYCAKCKGLKYIIYDFRLITEKRRGQCNTYYCNRCKECECNFIAAYQTTGRGLVSLRNYQKKRKAENRALLTDEYIKQLIQNRWRFKGVKIKISEISVQEITHTRQEIIARRAKQTQKKQK